jgi:hypothetical protein
VQPYVPPRAWARATRKAPSNTVSTQALPQVSIARVQREGSPGLMRADQHAPPGEVHTVSLHLPLVLQATTPWQPHLEEETRCRVHLPRLSAGPSGGEILSLPARGAQETGAGVPDRRVIVDNGNQRGLGPADLPGLACVLHRSMYSIGGT